MLHKWEAMLGLPEDSLAYQMEEYYPVGGEYPEEAKDGQLVEIVEGQIPLHWHLQTS